MSATINLGVVRQGESVRHTAWLRNNSKTAVHITDIKKSCECLEVELAEKTIEPNQRTLVDVRYDGAKEPDFVGSLQIEVELLGDDQAPVGMIEVPVEVIPGAKKGG